MVLREGAVVAPTTKAFPERKKIMTCDELKHFVGQHVFVQQNYYLKSRHTKKAQENHYNDGLIRMNINLFEEWLDTYTRKTKGATDVYKAYMALPTDKQREVWEASGFHFIIYGYRKEEADAYWNIKVLKAPARG